MPLVQCTTPSPSPTTLQKNATTGTVLHTSNGDLSTANPSECSSCRVVRSRVRSRVRPRVLWAPLPNGGGSAHDDLALPLGMLFAAVLSQVLNKNKQGERIPLDLFSKMCTSAVKESVTNINGDKCDHFMRNFEKSFRSTLQTLHLIISRTSIPDQEDARFSDQLVKTFIDVLVTGLIIMLVCFGYGTYVFSYQRITEVTETCSSISKGSNSWWIPKEVSSFNNSGLLLQCHVIVFTRLGFRIIMFLALAWLIIKELSVGARNMPITYNVMLLGGFYGVAGKWCVDGLGGNGLCWLIFWEMLCLIHFLVNAFPVIVDGLLHGPVNVSQGIEVVRKPYWVGRYMLYVILLLILPVSAGLLPFASVFEWMEHLREKIRLVSVGEEGEL